MRRGRIRHVGVLLLGPGVIECANVECSLFKPAFKRIVFKRILIADGFERTGFECFLFCTVEQFGRREPKR